MKPDVYQTFVSAAREVLAQEMGEPIEAAKMRLQAGAYQTHDVTVIIGLTQAIEGAVIISIDKETASAYISHVMGEPCYELDEIAQSGLGELGNVIAGRAGVVLGNKGYDTVISPPTIIIGRGVTLSTLGLQRLVFPVQTPLGVVELHLAAKEMR